MADQLDLFAVDEHDDRPGTESAAAVPAHAADTMLPRAPDQADRDLVTGALGTTLFVEAGAGSGKTTALVQRVVNLIRSGVPVGSIAAITFTEKAAAELRHKIRTALAAASTGSVSSLAQAALDDLDQAPIGTLHAFARRLLGEFPVEAELPPQFGVLDEVQSATAFHERFTDFLETLLDDPESVRLVELCQHDGFGVEKGVRLMAEDFQANWDLVAERVSPQSPSRVDDAPLQRRLADLCHEVAAFQPPPGDSQEQLCREIAAHARVLAGELPFGELLRLLSVLAGLKPKGNAANWKRHHRSDDVLPAYKAAVVAVASTAKDAVQQLNEERRLTLGALLREFTLESVRLRRRDGELEFHDLLVLARQLVAEDDGVRAQLHQRYTHLLLDEFQDTDPIQLELAVRITAEPAGQPADWMQLRPLAGRLTVVGDPKQSIYRFRRADISQFLRAREQIGADRAALSANFRSTAPVIEWVNTTMGRLIEFTPDVQPDYEPLVAARLAGHDHGTVTVLGALAHTDLPAAHAEMLREAEATDVAATVVQALAEGWPVWRDDSLQPCRPGDITILLPSRLSLPALQVALAARDVPYRAENSSLVYGAPEVRALMLALRAADDPTDELAIVSALRTPLFGCSDRHLYEWKVTHGRRWQFTNLADLPVDLRDHPVAAGLACLGEVALRIPYSTPSQLLAWLVEERCVMELALAQRDSRDVWRRVRFVVDQARAWSEAGGHGVRRYLLWTRLQGDEGRFVAETVLPETDHDVVRIMTVHAAKGLEFPITIVSGLTAQPRVSRGRRVVWPPGTWALSTIDDPTYEQFAPVDEQMGEAERKRLLYVACTRAMDHLVVSLHRAERSNGSAAHQLAVASEGAPHRSFSATDLSLPARHLSPAELPWADEGAWFDRWQSDLAAASRPAALGATTLARRLARPAAPATDDDGLQKDAVDLDLPPWQRGRYGTAVGRAVHAVLQCGNLRTGADFPALAAAQAAAEGVLGHERTIERLARSALLAPAVAEGIAGPHWRELFVATEIGGTVVEGYIDLLVRRPTGGLLVVDYKTDQVTEGPEKAQRIERYGTQLAAYGLALEQLLGEPVAAGVLVMCRPSGAAEQVEIPDWPSLQRSLHARLIDG
ncbi:MAG: UvrD-helicase domain-containing protein [Ilumatobacteraceae bacterium]